MYIFINIYIFTTPPCWAIHKPNFHPSTHNLVFLHFTVSYQAIRH